MSQSQSSPDREKNLSFEDAMTRLEEIVRAMEGGAAKLEDMIALFEEAKKLAAFCRGKLDSLKKKIETLTGDGAEGPPRTDFDPSVAKAAEFLPDDAAPPPQQPAGRARAARAKTQHAEEREEETDDLPF